LVNVQRNAFPPLRWYVTFPLVFKRAVRRERMSGQRIFAICTSVVVGLFVLPHVAMSQQKPIKEQIVGAWTLVSVTAERPDGSKGEPFGNNPKGIIIFTPDGYFSLLQSRADVPKLAENDRAKATPEEAKGIVSSSIAYYGTYSVNEAEKSLVVKIEGSTFSNLIGPEQKRIVTSLTSEELKFTNPRTPAGVTLQTGWKRASAK
jgi:Lipocalin-like domain